jgi:hypothetical protein
MENVIKLPGILTQLPKEKEVSLPTRFGTPIEKNVPLSEEKLERLEEALKKKLNIWSAYPDIWADEVLVPTSSSFHFMFYQRLMMRQLARFPLNHITAARGVSKTFITLFMAFHRCIFCPGSSIAFAAPNKTQSAQIGKQTVNDLLNRFPILNNELDGPVIGGKDYFEVRFKNGSKIEITAALESTRGRRFDGIDVDEARDQEGDSVNGILVPTVSKVRMTYGAGKLNPYENHQMQTYTSSASSKSSYNYEKVIDLLIKMIINPKSACVMGLDYKVPVIEGIYPASFVRDIRMDSTMNEQLFAREYLSIFTAESDESWFNFKKLNIHRKMVNAEWEAKFNNNNKDTYYLVSVDVGRLHDATVATVFKVVPNNGRHRAIVVNIFMLGRSKDTKQFRRQAIDLKKIIKSFQPREVIIDTNGLGIGFAELMIQTQYDELGNEWPAYGFFNDDDFKKIQPADAPRIMYSFKANHKINSEMFGNCYSRIDAGLVDFLIKEQDARSKLLATKKGQKMSVEQKTKFLMPYEMTSKLFEEMGNLRLKRTGAGLDIVLEPINSRFPDDRFSSLCIGLRRIKELEEEEAKLKKRRTGTRQLVFFSGG